MILLFMKGQLFTNIILRYDASRTIDNVKGDGGWGRGDDIW